MKGKYILAMLCLLCVFLSGCRTDFRYASDPATAVEIALLVLEKEELTLEAGEYTVLATLPEEQIAAFMADFSEVPCKRYLNDPSCFPQGQVVRITYADGCFDLLNRSSACPYMENGEHFPGQAARDCVYFDGEKFDVLAARYFGVAFDPNYGMIRSDSQ